MNLLRASRLMAQVRRQPRWVTGLFALSAANLNLLALARELIYFDEASAYYMPAPRAADYLAMITLTLVLAVVIYALVRALSRLPPPLHGFALFVLVGMLAINPLNFLRLALGVIVTSIIATAGTPLLALYGAGAVLAGLLALWFHRTLAALAYALALVLSPFALSTLAQAGWYAYATPDFAPAQAAAAPRHNPGPAAAELGRVLWITFDALDRRVLFSERPAGYDFAAFDALRAQAVYASRVKPLGGPTKRAMPSAWLGRRLHDSTPAGPARLEVRFEEDGEVRAVDELPHLFEAAAALGADVAIVGFYHPYCRMFAGYYSRCASYTNAVTRARRSRGFGDAVGLELRALTPLWPRFAHIEGHRASLAAATAAAADGRHHLVFVHSLVPHGPWIYDPDDGGYTLFRVGDGYADNVRLADAFMARVRAAMEQAGLWDGSAVIITADHGLTPVGVGGSESDAVPFLLKLPGQRAPLSFDGELDQIVVKDLVLALLGRELRTPAEAVAWLEARS